MRGIKSYEREQIQQFDDVSFNFTILLMSIGIMVSKDDIGLFERWCKGFILLSLMNFLLFCSHIVFHLTFEIEEKWLEFCI